MPLSDIRLARIQRASAWLHLVLTALLPGIPLLLALGWALIPDAQLGDSLGLKMMPGAQLGPLTLLDRTMGFGASLLLPTGIILYGVWHLRALFGLYAQGIILGPDNAERLRALAMTLILWMPAQMLGDIVVSLAMSLDNAAGERFVAISLSSNDVAIALVGAVALVISWVMVEAARAAEDSASII